VAETSNVDAVLAVYTGATINDLVLASRYSSMEFPAESRRGRNSETETFRPSEPFSEFAKLTLDAVPGTTYYVYITGEGNTRGTYTLKFQPTRNNLVPLQELLPARSDWSSLIHRDGSSVTIDPATGGSDFYNTWHTPAAYDGPDFSAPVAAPIGYGTVNALKLPLAEDLWTAGTSDAPPSGSRYTSYHRTTFTRSSDISSIAIEGLFDDGAFFFINGNLVGSLKMPGDAVTNDWTQLSLDQNIPGVGSTEESIQYLTIDGLNLQAGQPVDLAESLHNQTTNSSDMGFDLRVFAAGASPPSESIVLSISPATIANRHLLEWTGIAGSAYNIEENTTLSETGWTLVNPTPIEADTTGPISEQVVSTSATMYYRVVPTTPAP